MKMRKTQFNTRIPDELAVATRTVRARLGFTNDDMARMGLEILLGKRDRTTLSKARLIRSAAKDMSLSFDGPQAQLPGFVF